MAGYGKYRAGIISRAGTTSTIAITTGTAGQRLDATDGICNYIACFPRSLTSVLPPVLYNATT